MLCSSCGKWKWRCGWKCGGGGRPKTTRQQSQNQPKTKKGLLILSARLIEKWQVSGHYYYLGTWISLRERWLASNKCKQPNIVSCYVTQSISIPLSITHNPSIIHRPPPTSTSHYPSIFGCIRKKQKKKGGKKGETHWDGPSNKRTPLSIFIFTLSYINKS